MHAYIHTYKRLGFTRILVSDYRGGARHGARGAPPRNNVKLPRNYFSILYLCTYIYIYIYVKSPLHVFPCMSVSYQQVHPCPSAVELCSRARKREPLKCWPPVGARCQFVIGSGAPPGAQLKAWPMKRRFAASVWIATMLGSN